MVTQMTSLQFWTARISTRPGWTTTAQGNSTAFALALGFDVSDNRCRMFKRTFFLEIIDAEEGPSLGRFVQNAKRQARGQISKVWAYNYAACFMKEYRLDRVTFQFRATTASTIIQNSAIKCETLPRPTSQTDRPPYSELKMLA